VNGLLTKYSEQVDFIGLNIDDPSSLPVRERYDIVQRSQYVLLDGQGNVVRKWFGFLDEADVASEIDKLLAQG
jgi:hypothetical protein